MTGPLYQTAADALPKADEPHTVPSGYWKIVIKEVSGTLHVAGFIMNQDTARTSPIANHTKTIREIHQASGLEFFPYADQSLRDELYDINNSVWLTGIKTMS